MVRRIGFVLLVAGFVGGTVEAAPPGEWRQVLTVLSDTLFMGVRAPTQLRAYAAGLGNLPPDNGGIVYRSNNSGLTWEARNPEDFVFFLSQVDFVSAQRGWAGGMQFITPILFSTSDGGETWNRLLVPFQLGVAIMGLDFVDPSFGMAGGDGGYLIRTENGGLSWRRIEIPTTGRVEDIEMLSTEVGYIVGGLGEPPEEDRPYSVTPRLQVAAEGMLWREEVDAQAWTGGFVFKTTDGGLTWEPLIQDAVEYFYDSTFIDADRGWLIGTGEDSYSHTILATDDGGLTWSEIPLPPHPTGDPYFVYAGAWYTGDEGYLAGGRILPNVNRAAALLLYTSDGGLSFEVDTSYERPHAMFALDFVDRQLGFAVGTEQTILRYQAPASATAAVR